jgi:hypothetical protein
MFSGVLQSEFISIVIQNETWLVHRQLQLSGNTSPASITVSVVFRPVPSVAQSELRFHDSFAPLGTDDDELLGYNHGKRNSVTWMQQAVCEPS